MAIDLKDTRTLLGVMEQTFTPATLFRDTFFPNEITFVTNEVDMEYKKVIKILESHKEKNFLNCGENKKLIKGKFEFSNLFIKFKIS